MSDIPAEIITFLDPLCIPSLTKPLLWQRLSPLIQDDPDSFLRGIIKLLQQEQAILKEGNNFRKTMNALNNLVQPFVNDHYITNEPHDYSVAQDPINFNRNRYPDILASEKWRVKCRDGTYRNYSHFGDARILGQAPSLFTFGEFFSMVMEKKIDAIICLTAPESSKMEPYWQDDGDFMCGGFDVKFKVNVLSKTENGNIICRQLKIFRLQPNEKSPPINQLTKSTDSCDELAWSTDSCDGSMVKVLPAMEVVETYLVTHLMYTGWPDNGVPDSVQEFTKLFDMMKQFQHCLVHCSAGVGRTGTLITIETFVEFVWFVYHKFKDASKLAVSNNPIIPNQFIQFTIPSLILAERQYRDCLVQNKEQLSFCYRAIISTLQHVLSGKIEK